MLKVIARIGALVCVLSAASVHAMEGAKRSGQVQLAPDASEACPPALTNRPVAWPEDQPRDVGGTVVLELTVDACGAVTDATVTTGSGHAPLDRAAREAAADWFFEPSLVSAGRVRLPVAFQSEAEAAKTAGDIVAQYRRMTFLAVRAADDGTLPGYIPDTLPLEATTVAGMVALLERTATRLPDSDHVRSWQRRNGIESVIYQVYDDPGWPWAPALVRRRLVFDAQQAFWVATLLCDASADACRGFTAQMTGSDSARQQALPPPPPLPPQLTGDAGTAE